MFPLSTLFSSDGSEVLSRQDMAARKAKPAPAKSTKKRTSKQSARSKTPAKKPAKKAGKKAKSGKPASPAKKAAKPSAKVPQAKAKKARPAKAKVKAKVQPAKVKKPEPAIKLAHATPAKDAVSALAQKKAIAAMLSPAADGKAVVDAYMRDVDHPFKAEMEALRQIILGASSKISERIKWNAPSFFYKEDLGAFNPRATEFAHLILLFPGGAGMQDDGELLEGQHKDRREAKFHNMAEVVAKKPALEKLIKRWVALRDR